MRVILPGIDNNCQSRIEPSPRKDITSKGEMSGSTDRLVEAENKLSVSVGAVTPALDLSGKVESPPANSSFKPAPNNTSTPKPVESSTSVSSSFGTASSQDSMPSETSEPL